MAAEEVEPVQAELMEPVDVDPARSLHAEAEGIDPGNGAGVGDHATRSEMPPVVEAADLLK